MPICWGLFGCVEKRVNVFDLREGSVGWQQGRSTKGSFLRLRKIGEKKGEFLFQEVNK